jgi:hypothetical protein
MEEFDDPNKSEFGGDGEELSNLLQVGNNFVIPTIEGNAKGVDFYILQCQRQNSWLVNILYVFGVVHLTWVIMLWLGPITKNGGMAVSHMCF